MQVAPPALDRVFQALADPTRRDLVERLCRGSASASELARPLPMTLAAVVQHLQLLEASGLVHSQKVGRVRTFTMSPAALRSAEQWIADRRTIWERRLDRLGEILAEPEPEPESQPTQPGEQHITDTREH
jgi:DNA-binding transcriptional ArsR family regulator